jgi:hypothetical protein
VIVAYMCYCDCVVYDKINLHTPSRVVHTGETHVVGGHGDTHFGR